jgi:hypothetical protein
MINFIKTYQILIPFALTALCNFWIGISWLNKRDVPLAMAYFAWAAASVFLCWHYFSTVEVNG